jgi:putative membrane protein
MTRLVLFAIGVALLGLLWLGPLPSAAATSFSAHMLLHMGIVAGVAPLIAGAIAGSALDPAVRWPGALHPVAASVVELVVVWGWHAPLFHLAARHDANVLIAEQASFLAAGLWLWLAALRGLGAAVARPPWAGVGALLFTSVHMTLLAALFALAPREVYGHGASDLDDQHLGGSLMLLIGGGAYLGGGLWLAWEGLAGRDTTRRGVA